MKKVFTFLFLSSTSLACMTFSRDVFNDNFTKFSNLSVVPISYDVETRYNDDLIYGEERVVTEGSDGYKLVDSDVVVVKPINKVVEIGRGPISISYGSTTGYGADCVGCSGNVACSTSYGTHNLLKDGVFYNDSKYGKVRIIAADNSLYSCGTIIEIDNSKLTLKNANVTPTAKASILVAIASINIVFTSTLSFLFSTSSSVESFIIFPPITASKINAIQ